MIIALGLAGVALVLGMTFLVLFFPYLYYFGAGALLFLLAVAFIGAVALIDVFAVSWLLTRDIGFLVYPVAGAVVLFGGYLLAGC